MNPLARPVLLAAAGSLLAVLFVSAELTDAPPFALPPSFIGGPTNLDAFRLSPAPIVHAKPAQPLKPGVYQTRPYAMILVVPEPGHDDRCVIGEIGQESKMPIIHPDVKAAPKADSK